MVARRWQTSDEVISSLRSFRSGEIVESENQVATVFRVPFGASWACNIRIENEKIVDIDFGTTKALGIE